MEHLVYSSADQSALKTYDNEEGGGKGKSMTIETMGREFRFDGVRLPDPNPKLSIEEVRTAFSATYPEIATAAVTGPEALGNKLVYHFVKAIGTKG
jgi:PRTRC genetic system protein C